MTRAYLSLGSNVGDRLLNLVRALRALEDAGRRGGGDGVGGGAPALTLEALSPAYETDPLGPEGEVVADQPAFLNCAAAVDTTLTASELRWLTAGIETALGRRAGERWRPRTVDIDLVLYGQERIELPHLVVPHARMAERAFVLRPLTDIDPGLSAPGIGALAPLLRHLGAQGCRLHTAAEALCELVVAR